jgi:hypothetical protein
LLAIITNHIFSVHPAKTAFIEAIRIFTGTQGDHGFFDGDPAKPSLCVAGRLGAFDYNGKRIEAMCFNKEAMEVFAQQASDLLDPSHEQHFRQWATGFTQRDPDVQLDGNAGHIENFYLERIKGIPEMQVNEFHVIGDRNWLDARSGELVYSGIYRVSEEVFVFASGHLQRQIDGTLQMNHIFLECFGRFVGLVRLYKRADQVYAPFP